jgi:protein TonB
MNKLYSKRGEAGISTTGKKAMGNLVTTTSKPMLSDMLSPNGSGRLMQDATVNSWASMSSNRSDIYSSNKQAPVAPVSVPMFATDLLEFKRDQTSNAVSFVIHVVAITLLLTIALKVHNSVVLEEPPIVTPVDFKLTVPPPITMPVAKVEGGGGQRSIVQPKADPVPTPIARAPQIHTTQIIRLDNPKLALEPSDQVKMPDSPNALPAFAASQGPQIALATQPKATGSGFGSLGGGGLGGGHGVGSGGGYGGGLMSVGGGVSAPVVIHTVAPDFTEDARRANFQGNVSIRLIVDSQGNPQDVTLVSHLGMGLEEKAIEAVRQYKFKPAMFQGHPVSVQIVIDVAFHLH